MAGNRFESDGWSIFDGEHRLGMIQASKLLNELYNENKKLRTLNYVNKEAVRLNNIKTVSIGAETVDCSNINWELLYELYGEMIDHYYKEDNE